MHVSTLVSLHDQGRMTWTEQEHGWVAAPEDVLEALARGGFHECKREMTTSRRDLRPSGGVWQGVNRITGSVASAIWVARATQRQALIFIEIDGETVNAQRAAGWRAANLSYRDEGGES
jgi:hypothetical protein